MNVAAWTRPHALAMLASAGAALWLGDGRLLALPGALSFAWLLYLGRGRYTAGGALGWANGLTLVRLGLTLALALLTPGPAAALLVFLVFALDGLDGLVARRSGTASAFGAQLDMEADALLVAIAVVVLVLHGREPAPVLLAGALRYLYALLLPLLPARGREPPPSRLGRHAFSLMVLALCASLWPLPQHTPVVLLATALLTHSFARSVVWALRPV